MWSSAQWVKAGADTGFTSIGGAKDHAMHIPSTNHEVHYSRGPGPAQGLLEALEF